MKNATFPIMLSAILLYGSIVSCNSLAPKQNVTYNSKSGVSIPRDTMVRILIDLHLAEAMVQSVRRDRDTTVKATIQDYYDTIFANHKVSEKEFKEAFMYYSRDIEVFDSMYEDMQIQLSKMEEQAKVH